MADMFSKISWFDRVLEILAWLVVIVATGSMLASMYNSMNERRRDLAIMRALGARRFTISSAIILEAASIAALGAAMGYDVYFGILAGVARVVRSQTGVVLDVFDWSPVFVFGPVLIIFLGVLAGLIPALKAYKTDVVANLTPN